MKPIPPIQFVFTGVLHSYLSNVRQGASVHGSSGVLGYVTQYIDYLTLIGFELTGSAVWAFNGVREELELLPTDATLTATQAQLVNETAIAARETLYAEGRSRTVFEVTDKKFDVKKLLYDVGGLMREGLFDELPILAAVDLGEAGKCIAFERPTAAAFHTLRATEEVLRHYYTCYAKTRRIKTPRLWGPILQDLAKRRTKPPKPLIDHLDAIRENFRNPTQHPEKLYDIDEAQDAFAQCLDAISRMARDRRWVTPTDGFGVLRKRMVSEAESTQLTEPSP
jgi:hypothetical protein